MKIRGVCVVLGCGWSIMTACGGLPPDEGTSTEEANEEPIGELEQTLCTGEPPILESPTGDLYPNAPSGQVPTPTTTIHYRYDSWVPNGTPVPCPGANEPPYVPDPENPDDPPYCSSVPEGPPPSGWGLESQGAISWKGLIRTAMNQWQAATNGRVQFVEGLAPGGVQDTIILRSLGSCGGTGHLHETSLNCAEGALAHELGHALGLAHEQQRSDRDKYIIVNKGSDNCTNYGDVFPKFINDIWNGGSEYGPYDVTSAMHYCSFIDEDWPFRPTDMLRRGDGLALAGDSGCMGAPNAHDGSAAIELYARQYRWGKFVTLERDLGSTVPWDPTIAPGVNMVGGPTATTLHAEGSLHIFSLGSDKQIWSKGQQDGNVWEWYSIGAPSGATAVGEPAAATTAGTTGMVVGTVATTGAGTKIWLREWNGNWGSWTSLSGPTPGFSSVNSLALSSWGNGRLDVFVRAADNAIWHRFKTPAGWNSWFNLGGYATTKPAAASWGVGRIDVFVGSSDHQLYHRACATEVACNTGDWTPSAPNWEAQGGWLADGTHPAVVAADYRWLDVFAISGDNRIHFKRYRRSTGWQPSLTGWYQLGGNTVGGSIGVASPYAGHIDLAARLSDGGLWHRWTADNYQ